MTDKRCSHCGLTLPVFMFFRHHHTADGRFNQCRFCVVDRQTIGFQRRRARKVGA